MFKTKIICKLFLKKKHTNVKLFSKILIKKIIIAQPNCKLLIKNEKNINAFLFIFYKKCLNYVFLPKKV